MIKRLLPMPLHSVLLWMLWLILNDFSAGHLVLGAFLALLIPWLAHPLSDPHVRVKRPLKALQYALMVLWDIVVSNFEVAYRVLMPNSRLRPGMVVLPLTLQEELPLAILASTISLTPGTVSVDFSLDRQWLYIHALHVDSEDALIAHIQQRYERPLREIFAC